MKPAKVTLFIVLSLVMIISGFVQKSTTKPGHSGRDNDLNCSLVFGTSKAIQCAHIAEDISAFSGDWPANTNSTLFFKKIEGNLNLKSINFCGVFVDSLTSSIGRVPNLETLQLSRGNITYIPKEIGKLKKLKTLILGTSKDECMGNKVRVIPKEIGDCESLEHLGLAFSEVPDLPGELENCKNLKVVDLSFNKVITKATLENLEAEISKY